MSPGRSAARPTLAATRSPTDGPSLQIRSSHRWGSPSHTGSWARASPASPSIKRTISGSVPSAVPDGAAATPARAAPAARPARESTPPVTPSWRWPGSSTPWWVPARESTRSVTPASEPAPGLGARRARRAATSESRWRSRRTRRSRSAGATTAPVWGNPLSVASRPPSRSIPYRCRSPGGRVRAKSRPAVIRVVVVPDPGPPTTTRWPQPGCHPSVNRRWPSGSSTSQAAGAPGSTVPASSSASTASGSGGGHGDRGRTPPRRWWAASTALTTRAMSGSPSGPGRAPPALAGSDSERGRLADPSAITGAARPSGSLSAPRRSLSVPAGTARPGAGVSSRTRTRRPRSAGGVTPVTKADWNAVSSPGPNRARARPGRDRGMAAASAAPITSLESWRSVTRRAIRQLVLALMSSVTAPAGRWVASTRWTPRLRPRWPTLTRESTNSGSSAARVANSSTTTTSRGSGSSPPPAPSTEHTPGSPPPGPGPLAARVRRAGGFPASAAAWARYASRSSAPARRSRSSRWRSSASRQRRARSASRSSRSVTRPATWARPAQQSKAAPPL